MLDRRADAELLALEPEWRNALNESDRALAAHSRLESAYLAAVKSRTATHEMAAAVERADAAARTALERLSQLEAAIATTPAVTLAGAACKARTVEAYGEEIPHPALLPGLLADVQRIAERAA